MRILWVKTELLHPVDKGGRIRTYQMLRSLSRRHHVTYLCLDDGQAAPDALERAREYAQEVIVVPFRPAASGAWDSLRSAAQSLLAAAVRHCPLSFASSCANGCSSLPVRRPDRVRFPVAVGECAGRLARTDGSLRAQCRSDDLAAPCLSAPALPCAAPTCDFSGNACCGTRRANAGASQHVIAVSPSDAELIRREYGVASVGHVPTGVDLEYFSASRPRPPESRELVFIGSMDWMPNEDGIRWFASDVFGRVQERIPGARLTGGRPVAFAGHACARGAQFRIEVTGTVADVRPYLERAAVSVVPLRVGGGTRLKIYEAMAMGVPVVSTTIGAEGLPLRNDEHLLIADTADEQVSAICALLTDRTRAGRLAAAARRYVQEHCSWDAVAERFLAQCPRRAAADEPSYQGQVA